MSLTRNDMLTTGDNRRHRRRGCVRVREPANGFFIAGSSLKEMNGVYIRQNINSSSSGNDGTVDIRLHYKHEHNAWVVNLEAPLIRKPKVRKRKKQQRSSYDAYHDEYYFDDEPSSEEEEEEEDDDDEDDAEENMVPDEDVNHWEWCFINPKSKRRIFRHDGDTIIPGAGIRWKHIHYDTDGKRIVENSFDSNYSLMNSLWNHDLFSMKQKNSNAIVKEDDENELPWQVIALLDHDILVELVWAARHRRRRVRESMEGRCFKSRDGTLEQLLSDMSGSCDMDNINFLYKNIELSKLVRVTSQAGAALYDALPVGDIGTATQLYPPQLICRIGVSQYLRVVEERLVVHTKETWLRLSNDEARQRAKTHNIHIHRYNNCWILKSDIEFVNEYDIGTLDIDKEIEEKKRNESTNQTSSSKDQAEPEEIIEDGIHLSGIHSEHLEASVFDKPFIPKLIDSSSTLSKTTSNDDELDLDLDDDDDALTLTKEEEEENHTNSIISNAIDNSENLKLVLNINFQSSNIINRINILNKEIGHDDILLAIINQTFNALPEKGLENAPLSIIKTVILELKKLSESLIQQNKGHDTEDKGNNDNVKNDVLIIRLSIIRALMYLQCINLSLREAKALEIEYPECSIVVLFTARCLLRRGQRLDGIKKLQRARDLANRNNEKNGLVQNGDVKTWAGTTSVGMLRALCSCEKMRVAADHQYEHGDFNQAVETYSKAIDIQITGILKEDKRGRAILLANRAVCYRRAAAAPELGQKDAMELLQKALNDLDYSLRLFPCFARAMFRRAVVLLELGDTYRSCEAFEDLYRLDRNWPRLDDWLVRSNALHKRATKGKKKSGKHKAGYFDEAFDQSNQSESQNHQKEHSIVDETNHYKVLGVTSDATAKQLKSAYRMTSLKHHPDRKGGSTAAFQRVQEAYEILSNPLKKQAYDDGRDIKSKRGDDDSDDDGYASEEEHKQTLREEIERKYFPERHEFWPFGDPFIQKRKREEKRRKKKNEPEWFRDDI